MQAYFHAVLNYTWFFRNTAIKRLWEYVLNRLVLASEQVQSAKAVASFYNSSAQFFRLGGVLILASSIVVLSYRSISHCLKQFRESV